MKTALLPTAIDDPAVVRQAGPDTLSLALMDARNHTLQLLALHEARPAAPATSETADSIPAAWMAGQVAWLAEWWTSRNPQRSLGARSPADGIRLASIEPQADAWFHPRGARWQQTLPDALTLRRYMLEQLEGTLELLDKTPASDDALHGFRLALLHEDLYAEQMVVAAQSGGVSLPLQPPKAQAQRPALTLPATRWTLGAPSGGFGLALEQSGQVQDVPAFDIDAQAVCWAQYVEFVGDGGYDRQELWHPQGWSWLQSVSRRAPGHVAQIGMASGAVMQTFMGRLLRLSGSQPVMHVSWWEADAFARWAGRRLPSEVEWEIAAHTASGRGFRWGDVLEWTAGSLQPWPGFEADAWVAGTPWDPQPLWGQARVLRGASLATRPRRRYPKARGFARPERDDGFMGFRTCAA